MGLEVIVGNIALVCTVASNLAGVHVCSKFVKSGSTANASGLPFIAAVICTSFWLQYGMLVQDHLLSAVNFIAVILQSCCVLCFYFYTNEKTILHQQLFSACAFLLLSRTYAIYFAESKKMAISVIGFLASGCSLFSCGAPLVSAKEVFRTRNTKVLPFPMILASFVVTSLWFLYGVLVKDNFVQIPNLFGALISGFQLCLFVIYP